MWGRVGVVAYIAAMGTGCLGGPSPQPGEPIRYDFDGGGTDPGDGSVNSPSEENPLVPFQPDCVDNDGDGFGANCARGYDCNDLDPSLNMICDGTGVPTEGSGGACSTPENEPVECYGQPRPASGGILCARGIRYCLGGRWTHCGGLGESYLVPRSITGPRACNACEPSCAYSDDYPTSADLRPDNSSNLVYNPAVSAVTVRSSLDVLIDTDADGVPDTWDAFPADPTRDGFTENGNIFRVVPEGELRNAPLRISVRVNTVDIYFMFDSTNSMTPERDNLAASLATVIIPGIQTAIPDAWFGVGAFSDFPISPFGAAGNRPYSHYTDITNPATGLADIQAGIAAIDTISGLGDGPEAIPGAIRSMATGAAVQLTNRVSPSSGVVSTYVMPRMAGMPPPGATWTTAACEPGAGTIGYPCFRTGSTPIIVFLTDSDMHNGPALTTAGAAFGPTYNISNNTYRPAPYNLSTYHPAGTAGGAAPHNVHPGTGYFGAWGTWATNVSNVWAMPYTAYGPRLAYNATTYAEAVSALTSMPVPARTVTIWSGPPGRCSVQGCTRSVEAMYQVRDKRPECGNQTCTYTVTTCAPVTTNTTTEYQCPINTCQCPSTQNEYQCRTPTTYSCPRWNTACNCNPCQCPTTVTQCSCNPCTCPVTRTDSTCRPCTCPTPSVTCRACTCNTTALQKTCQACRCPTTLNQYVCRAPDVTCYQDSPTLTGVVAGSCVTQGGPTQCDPMTGTPIGGGTCHWTNPLVEPAISYVSSQWDSACGGNACRSSTRNRCLCRPATYMPALGTACTAGHTVVSVTPVVTNPACSPATAGAICDGAITMPPAGTLCSATQRETNSVSVVTGTAACPPATAGAMCTGTATVYAGTVCPANNLQVGSSPTGGPAVACTPATAGATCAGSTTVTGGPCPATSQTISTTVVTTGTVACPPATAGATCAGPAVTMTGACSVNQQNLGCAPVAGPPVACAPTAPGAMCTGAAVVYNTACNANVAGNCAASCPANHTGTCSTSVTGSTTASCTAASHMNTPIPGTLYTATGTTCTAGHTTVSGPTVVPGPNVSCTGTVAMPTPATAIGGTCAVSAWSAWGQPTASCNAATPGRNVRTVSCAMGSPGCITTTTTPATCSVMLPCDPPDYRACNRYEPVQAPLPGPEPMCPSYSTTTGPFPCRTGIVTNRTPSATTTDTSVATPPMTAGAANYQQTAQPYPVASVGSVAHMPYINNSAPPWPLFNSQPPGVPAAACAGTTSNTCYRSRICAATVQEYSVGYSAGTDRISLGGHPFVNGDQVTFRVSTAGRPPGGVDYSVTYFVRNRAVNDFQLSLTAAGPIVDITNIPPAVGTLYVATAGFNEATCPQWSYEPGLDQFRRLGVDTGSVDPFSGQPVSEEIQDDGTGLGQPVVDAIQRLAQYLRQDITLRPNNNPATLTVDERNFLGRPAPPGDSVGGGWITVPTADIPGPPLVRGSISGCTSTSPLQFVGCLPGTRLDFDVLISNVRPVVAATPVAQRFDFTVDTLANGTQVLGTTNVTVIVPPIPIYEPEGRYSRDYDSTAFCEDNERPQWETLTWTPSMPARPVPMDTQLFFEVRASNTLAGLASATPVLVQYDTNVPPVNLATVLGPNAYTPFLRVTAVLRASPDLRRAPILAGFETVFHCVPLE